MSINLVKALSNFFFYPQTQQEGGKVTWCEEEKKREVTRCDTSPCVSPVYIYGNLADTLIYFISFYTSEELRFKGFAQGPSSVVAWWTRGLNSQPSNTLTTRLPHPHFVRFHLVTQNIRLISTDSTHDRLKTAPPLVPLHEWDHVCLLMELKHLRRKVKRCILRVVAWSKNKQRCHEFRSISGWWKNTATSKTNTYPLHPPPHTHTKTHTNTHSNI